MRERSRIVRRAPIPADVRAAYQRGIKAWVEDPENRDVVGA